MAYEKPITVKEAITSIKNQEFILPAIQREFVWNTKQIELLFDSILRDYPISTFLFWKVKADNIKRFKFYKFLPYYHQRDKKHNEPAELTGDIDRFAILDGQQRLTSLYLGLKGSYAFKLARYNWKSDHAFPPRLLYINLLAPSKDSDLLYDFKFLSKEEHKLSKQKFSQTYHWFRVGNILEFEDVQDILKYITKFSLMDSSMYSVDQMNFVSETLSKLFNCFNQKELINFYLEKSDELDKVLHIFIRVNSGGTKLSYSDLLLSIATAQWEEKAAREVIHRFVDQLNTIGDGFEVKKDLVLKSCLVLSDIKDIKFKVDNFSSENMSLIETEWDDIAKSLNVAIQLISSFGFCNKTLTAYNAIIPIAYFIKKNKIGEEILHTTNHSENRKNIKEWLIRALLKKVFGGVPDNLYPTYRNIISENPGIFPLQKLIDRYKGTNRSLSFDKETIENLLNTQYGSAFAFMILSLIYPLNHNYKFHQDHIHPKKYFTNKELIKLGIVDENIRNKYLQMFNTIPNIQLIQETQNLEKSSKLFSEWLKGIYSETELINYKNLHFIPNDNDLTMSNFMDFAKKRRTILKSKLMDILQVEKALMVEDETFEISEEELV
jgi:uncharacterized protein with ParB-like and HNH nuclease domain